MRCAVSSVDDMHEEGHAAVPGAAESPAPSFKVANLGWSDGDFGGVAFGDGGVDMQVLDKEAVGDVVGGQGEDYGFAFLQCDLRRLKEKTLGVNLNAAGRRLGSGRMWREQGGQESKREKSGLHANESPLELLIVIDRLERAGNNYGAR